MHIAQLQKYECTQNSCKQWHLFAVPLSTSTNSCTLQLSGNNTGTEMEIPSLPKPYKHLVFFYF